MPYIKNKQQAFQAAQQAIVQAEEATSALHPSNEDYGHHFKNAEREIEEAEQVIDKALRNASEHQRQQLQQYQSQLNELKASMNNH